MVKISIVNERLILERGGKHIQLESATIFHDRKAKTYKIVIFPTSGEGRGKEFTQKGYPIPGIHLEKARNDIESLVRERGIYYHLSTKNFYINYYLK